MRKFLLIAALALPFATNAFAGEKGAKKEKKAAKKAAKKEKKAAKKGAKKERKATKKAEKK